MKIKYIFITILALFNSQLLPMQGNHEIKDIAEKVINGDISAKDLNSYDSQTLEELKEYMFNNPDIVYGKENEEEEDLGGNGDENRDIASDETDFFMDIKNPDATQLKIETSIYYFIVSEDLRTIEIIENNTNNIFILDLNLYEKYDFCAHIKNTEFICLYGENCKNIIVIDLDNKYEFTFSIKALEDNFSIIPRISNNKYFSLEVNNNNSDDNDTIQTFDLGLIISIEKILNSREQHKFAESLQVFAKMRESFIKKHKHN